VKGGIKKNVGFSPPREGTRQEEVLKVSAGERGFRKEKGYISVKRVRK